VTPYSCHYIYFIKSKIAVVLFPSSLPSFPTPSTLSLNIRKHPL
uniref:Uncharacterized protein n=2 Tax=Macaca fascicularis TaxID=9541 RepID=A0A7N9D3A5_MACFA